jgi:hypothetical protein
VAHHVTQDSKQEFESNYEPVVNGVVNRVGLFHLREISEYHECDQDILILSPLIFTNSNYTFFAKQPP